MSTVRVSGFTIQPSKIAKAEEKNELREWIVAFEQGADFVYCQLIDDFVTAFEKDPVKACEDKDNTHIQSLMAVYEKNQVFGTGLISLLAAAEKDEQYTNESFAKKQWALYFGTPPDEKKWNEAIRKMDAAEVGSQFDIFTSELDGVGREWGTADSVFVSSIVKHLLNRTAWYSVLSLDDNAPLPEMLLKEAKSDNKPIIIKRGNKISIYGFKNKTWQETSLGLIDKEDEEALFPTTGPSALANGRARAKPMSHYVRGIPQIKKILSRGHDLLSVEARCKQGINMDEYLNIELEGEANLAGFLRRLLVGLRHKNQGEIREAINWIRTRQTKTFLDDIYRNGILLKDAQGEVRHYRFNNGGSTSAQSFEVVEKFLTAKGLSKDQITCISSSCHQAGWYSVMQNKLLAALGGSGRAYASPDVYLMIDQDARGQAIKATVRCPYRQINNNELLLSLVSINYALQNEEKRQLHHSIEESKENDSQSENLLPVPCRLKREQEKITVDYQAVVEEGCIGIPSNFGTMFSLAGQREKIVSRRKKMALALFVLLILGGSIAVGGIGFAVLAVLSVATAIAVISGAISGGMLVGLAASGLHYLWDREKADQFAVNENKKKMKKMLSVPKQDSHIKVVELDQNGQVVEFSITQLKEFLIMIGYQLNQTEKNLSEQGLVSIIKTQLARAKIVESVGVNLDKSWVKNIISVYGTQEQHQNLPKFRENEVSPGNDTVRIFSQKLKVDSQSVNDQDKWMPPSNLPYK